MESKQSNPSAAELELWIAKCFSSTQADEFHRPVFVNIFKQQVEEIQRDLKIDPVTDRLTLFDPDEPEAGTLHEIVERSALDRFNHYLSALNASHGSAYAEVFSQHRRNSDSDRASMETYAELYGNSVGHDVNAAWQDAHDTCLRLGHNEVYARHCADRLEGCGFSLAKAHVVTAKFCKDFKMGLERGYSDLRAMMYAEYQGPLGQSRPELVSLVYSRCVEEQMGHGRSLVQAKGFAEQYADCFDVDGHFGVEEENALEVRAIATIQAEAKWRFHPGNDGDKDEFVRAFETVARKSESGSQQPYLARYDQIERHMRESYSLVQSDNFSSHQRWVLNNPQ